MFSGVSDRSVWWKPANCLDFLSPRKWRFLDDILAIRCLLDGSGLYCMVSEMIWQEQRDQGAMKQSGLDDMRCIFSNN